MNVLSKMLEKIHFYRRWGFVKDLYPFFGSNCCGTLVFWWVLNLMEIYVATGAVFQVDGVVSLSLLGALFRFQLLVLAEL